MSSNPNTAHLSAHPSYWRPQRSPEQEALTKRRMVTGAAVRNAQREKCPNCERLFSVNGMGRHKIKCVNGEKRYTETRSPAHNTCACGLLKAKFADCCYRCEQISPEMEELNRLNAAGVTAPRRKL